MWNVRVSDVPEPDLRVCASVRESVLVLKICKRKGGGRRPVTVTKWWWWWW